MSKEQAKQTNDNQKCQKFCRELKEIQTKGESRQTMLERSVNSLLIDEFIKATIKGFLKVLQNSRNICWFNSLMVSPMNTWGVSRAIELSECRRNKMWYEFRHLGKLLNINITRDKLDMESLISARENYFDGSPHFSLGRQEDVADFFGFIKLSWQQWLWEKCPYSELFWSAFFGIRTEYVEILRISPYSVRMRENADQNNSEYGHFLTVNDEEFQSNTTYSISLRESVCSLEKDRNRWLIRIDFCIFQ